MIDRELLTDKSVAISISDSEDLAGLGLASEHLQDALAEISRHLLAMGARLIYGGDLRKNGFTELLFELVARHSRDAGDGDKRPSAANYLAWPLYFHQRRSELIEAFQDFGRTVELRLIDQFGTVWTPADAPLGRTTSYSDIEWATSLTAMRQAVARDSNARIVLGGRTTGYKGTMPGIAEEALCALRMGQPLYLLGGFGGCARDIAIALSLKPAQGIASDWHGLGSFQGLRWDSLNNGLNVEENCRLASTVHVDEAVALILRGFMALAISKE